MKQKISIEQFVNKRGGYKVDTNYSFRQRFSILELKHANILQRIGRINSLCMQHVREWEEKGKVGNNMNYELSFLQEEIVFHLRRAVDDMISLVWMMNEWEHGKKVVKVEIDSIGKYLSEKNRKMRCFDRNVGFLNILNNISNSYKHSVYQTILPLIGEKEAGFYMNMYQKNDTRNDEEECFYNQSDLLNGFQDIFDVYVGIVYEKKSVKKLN